MGALKRLLAVALLAACASRDEAVRPARPNILWITADDLSPSLGCYGDPYARTPRLDRLAAEGVRYTRAFATAPVCSPARSCLITGLYATTLGTQRLRSAFPIPDAVRGFPALLREAGYFCTNNVKTDYNTSAADRLIRESWDASSEQAHWRARPAGVPFFSVFNLMTTHQSRAMVWPHEQFRREVQSTLTAAEIHDPARAPVPPYYPDTPVVRRGLARAADCVTAMDRQVGDLLDALEADGLADDTIVFFFSDHGSGLPRHKRVLQDTGLQVPLIVRFPPRFAAWAPALPGGVEDRLVSFVDFAPTMLGLASLKAPSLMQGVTFLGGPPRELVFGARDRVDEVDDLSRSVRSADHLYVRNYMPHLGWAQPSGYSDQGEIQGEIHAAPTRPAEELYDVRADPLQLRNLAGDPRQAAELDRMRARLARWIAETRDVGFIPESIAWSRGRTPFELGHQPSLDRAVETASLVWDDARHADRQRELLKDPDDAVRTWAALGLTAGRSWTPELARGMLSDPAPAVRITAAAALAPAADGIGVLVAELEGPDALRACREIELLGERARGAKPAVEALHARVKDAAGDPAMFLRFSSEAFLGRLH